MIKDITGMRFGRLVAIEVSGRTAPRKAAVWACQCDCGAVVNVPGRYLRSGHTGSCGCLFRSMVSARASERNSKDVVGYAGAHKRVNDQRGSAKSHACIDCGGGAEHWSYDNTDPDQLIDPVQGCAYSLDPGHYQPRCASCHRFFDASVRRELGARVAPEEVFRHPCGHCGACPGDPCRKPNGTRYHGARWSTHRRRREAAELALVAVSKDAEITIHDEP